MAQEVDYIVRNASNRKEKLYLLKNVSGHFSPGQMTALMGPSGSGKTTLLDVMAGHHTVGEQQGHVLFAGAAASKEFLRRCTGYVEQFGE